MSEPTFAAKHGIYTLEWGTPEFLRFQIDHVRSETRSGDVNAEIVITSIAPGLEGLIHQSRFLLNGTSSRTTLAKHCASRTPGQEIDWPGHIEQASVKVLAAHRLGEPGIFLRDAEVPADTGYLLPPIVLGRLPTTWFGDSAAKSLLALAAGISIHSDRSDLLGIAPTATRVVGLFDWEMDAYEHKQRMRQLVGEQMPDFVYVSCRTAIWEDVDRLNRIIADFGINYGIFDSVGAACAGLPPESSEAPLRFHSALRQLSIGGLLIAHKVKADDGDRFPFGSAFWHYATRSSWFCKKDQEIDSSLVQVAMHQRKANTTSFSAPLAFDIRFADNRIAISRRDIRDVPSFAPTVPLRYRMQRALQTGPKTAVDLAEELEADAESIGRTARRDEKTFVRVPGHDGVQRIALRSGRE